MRPGVETLRSLPWFADLAAEQLDTLNEAGDLARFGPHESLLRDAQQPPEIMFTLSGYVATIYTDPKGQVIYTDVVGPAKAIGFSAALLGKPSPVGAMTITSARLVVIPATTLQTLMDRDQRLCRQFLNHALQETLDLTIECRELKIRSAAQRLAQYLVALAEAADCHPPRFLLPVEKRFVAGKIGCSQENLSRALSRLRAEGVETSQGGAVAIRDLARLRMFAGLAPTIA